MDEAGLMQIKCQMFKDFFKSLEIRNIDYVILSGASNYPDSIDSDIDFMVDDSNFARLKELFLNGDLVPESSLVQMLQHETTACYYILTRRTDGKIIYLHPDASASYRRGGRLWLKSNIVLQSRIRHKNGYWIPSPAVTFHYYLIKRLDKGSLENIHLKTLSELYFSDKKGCEKFLEMTFLSRSKDVLAAIINSDEHWMSSNSALLRAIADSSIKGDGFISKITNSVKNFYRKINRIILPTGFVVAVLGPDGSGKTTIIKCLEKELAMAFRGNKRFHLRPRFGVQSDLGVVTNPHASPPRPWPLCIIKLFYFLIDYWLGWLRLVLPLKIRSTLVIFDRYFHDILLDPVRYRVPPGMFAPKIFAALVPSPDLWIVLSAKPEQLVERKGEVTLDEAVNLTAAYISFAKDNSRCVIIDTSLDLDSSCSTAVTACLDYLEMRLRNRG